MWECDSFIVTGCDPPTRYSIWRCYFVPNISHWNRILPDIASFSASPRLNDQMIALLIILSPSLTNPRIHGYYWGASSGGLPCYFAICLSVGCITAPMTFQPVRQSMHTINAINYNISLIESLCNLWVKNNHKKLKISTLASATLTSFSLFKTQAKVRVSL